ncbi:Ribosomal protein S18 acetylase RimI [Mesobacillus persicus]|uniref:Ribosomal protein S18 acetylase RimI n=1 Tax=Mesobacillus persicus TaxID=930146 RepID=A0A1H7WCC9_9BACI|nr:GNAT family N-acetyltransferase [Mesobacillus persicus]SEM19226.1 Ribosomal protein S18 acetylase RimI [Mesobacillus persicus]
MKFLTTNVWDETLWLNIKDIYYEAFPDHGAKPEKIIRNMFEKGLCTFHIGIEENKPVAMALTGSTKESQYLIIDYLAVKKANQRQGIGNELSLYIKNWAVNQQSFQSILLEVEAEKASENLNRIHFWESCGFILLNDYIHHYIWVPEPYLAMVLPLHQTSPPSSGKEAFNHITNFHRQSFKIVNSNN